MKKLLLPLFLFFAFGAFAQKIIRTEKVTDHSIHIIGVDFEGILFDENYVQNPTDSAERKIKRFTPSNDEILLTEEILRSEGKNIKNKGDRKYIFDNLKDYWRQYIGYFNDEGEKCIYVNCFPVKEEWAIQKAKKDNKTLTIPRWYDSLFWVFDGGRAFWQAHVNLNKKTVVSMSINADA
jgi:hypothetical protein